MTEEWGLKIDILVNCGGIQRRHPAELFPDEDWEEVLQVNLSTCFSLARYVSNQGRQERREGGREERSGESGLGSDRPTRRRTSRAHTSVEN